MSKHIKGHTPAPLTYEPGTGKNWLIASCDFGLMSDGKHVVLDIVTDHMHGSDVRYGEPEADVRLWSTSPYLLKQAQALLAVVNALYPDPAQAPDALREAMAGLGDAITQATGAYETLADEEMAIAKRFMAKAAGQQQQAAPGVVALSAGAQEVVG